MKSTQLFNIERLELRQLLAGNVFSSIDGSGNNLVNPLRGATDIQLLRTAAAAYADGIDDPAGADRPSARAISNLIAAAEEDGTLNDRDMSAFVYAWGQFIDHDLDLTVTGSTPFNVEVPLGDEQFDPTGAGGKLIYLNRSAYDLSTGTDASNPREQTNTVTAWIDGSMIYGSDATRAASLRTLVGGKLKTSDGDLLPYNTDLLTNANDAHIFADDELFLAGDVRANENIELTSLHTLFMREHNRLADQIARRTRGLTDEQIYQRARQQVIAEIQAITYNEFLPAMLGTRALDRYRGYDAAVNPGIATEFSTAAFRLGHSMLGDDVEFLDNNGEEIRDELELAHAFFNPPVVAETGIDPILKYLASDRAQEIDTQVVDGVRNFLFGPPGAGGFDLASLNIQRGRDHGLADYNTMRQAYGLSRVTDFSQITSNSELAGKLESLYGSVDNIDVWVGGLAEDHVGGASVGQLFRTIVSDQFERLRDGDRFFYQNIFGGSMRRSLDQLHLSDVIGRNTELTNLQTNVFFFQASVSGQIFNDRNASGRRDFREGGLAGWTVQLLDEEGNVVDEVKTTASGRYRFDHLDLGAYSIHVVATDGWTQTTADRAIEITRGMDVTGVDYGYAGGAVDRPARPRISLNFHESDAPHQPQGSRTIAGR